ncbi:hypothetical protein [Streptomyces sp. NPDC090025]|uniref:hypothetical protein n=1 Tax=Streptomyces sp. NPDC090025 TaxID=3365922 RepID=UPI0038337236
MSEGPPGGSLGSPERPRIRQAVTLNAGAESARTSVGPVFVSQPGRTAAAPRPAGTEPTTTRGTGRAERRSRSTATEARPARVTPEPAPLVAVPAATPEEPDGSGSAPAGTMAASPTTAAPRAASDGATPPPHQTAGGSSGQGGRPLMAAAAIAGAVLVSVPLVMSQRSDAGQETRAVDDVTASAPVALLGEQGGATWPSPQGRTDRQSLVPAERVQEPSGGVPSKGAPGRQDVVDTSGYRPPPISPAEEKANVRSGTSVPRTPVRRPVTTPPVVQVVRGDTGGQGGRSEVRQADADREPATRPAVLTMAADKPAPPPVRRAAAGSATRTATEPAAVRSVKPAPAAQARTRAASPVRAAAKPSAPTARQGQTRVVHGTYVIGRGQSVSTNRISLTMQQNGNLVVFDANGRARWSTGTSGRGDRAVFQGDGNLVVLSAEGTTVWSTRTDGNPGAQLVLQNDGNVTIQAAGGRFLWGSGTQY